MKVQNLIHVSFSYWTDRSGCKCETICRCKRLEIKGVNHVSVKEYELKKMDPIEAYCIERILKKRILESKHNIEAHVSQGYYGEEISGWSHNQEPQVQHDIRNLQDLSSIEQVFYVLDIEYGHVPPHIKNLSNVSVVSRSVDDMRQKNFSGMVKKLTYEAEVLDSIPIGIINDQDNIIDGHHRLASTEQDVAQFLQLS